MKAMKTASKRVMELGTNDHVERVSTYHTLLYRLRRLKNCTQSIFNLATLRIELKLHVFLENMMVALQRMPLTVTVL